MQSVMLEGAGSWLSGRLCLGLCFKTNLFVPFYLEIKLNGRQRLQSCAATLGETCKGSAQTRLVSYHLGLNQQREELKMAQQVPVFFLACL